MKKISNHEIDTRQSVSLKLGSSLSITSTSPHSQHMISPPTPERKQTSMNQNCSTAHCCFYKLKPSCFNPPLPSCYLQLVKFTSGSVIPELISLAEHGFYLLFFPFTSCNFLFPRTLQEILLKYRVCFKSSKRFQVWPKNVLVESITFLICKNICQSTQRLWGIRQNDLTSSRISQGTQVIKAEHHKIS